MSFNPVPYDLAAGLIYWLVVVGAFLAVAGVTVFLTSFAAVGATGPLVVLNEVVQGIRDWLGTSLRRVGALTTLTIRESVRRKTLYVLVVFGLLFLFAGWFLTNSNTDAHLQVKVHVSFVLTTIFFLILPVALLLACWGLPDDIKARSLHTVVTKPVRRHEIVLGRILGYCTVGGMVLVVMGVVGYLWIVRQLPSNARSELIARVPIRGELTFRDREGRSEDAQGKPATGVNTGDEWEFRSFVEGNTKARAIWDFSGIDPQKLRDPLLLESNFEVFRTYKGNIEKGIICQFAFVNEAKNLRARLPKDALFEVRENRGNLHDVPRTLVDESGKTVDLFNDVIQDGKLRVEVKCLSGQQFVGVARPDLIVRLPDKPFAVSYFKAILGIGLMMGMVVVLGVISSCFVKGPVAMLLTFFVWFVGFVARPFLDVLTSGKHEGGLVIESVYRIGKHLNPSVPLENTLPNRIAQSLDSGGIKVLSAVKPLFPNFDYFIMDKYVANGFDVDWSAAIVPSLATAIGYIIPWMIVGYYSLKLRELESK